MISSAIQTEGILPKIRQYYELTKPGIVYGNLLTAAGGFLLAARTVGIDPLLFVATLIGLAGIIASACVFNNYLDRDIDVHMERTKNRALVVGVINERSALWFGTALGLAGIFILSTRTNLYTLSTAMLGFVVYLGMYTLLKRHTMYSTHVGAIAGAVPPVVGYTAITGSLDIVAAALFIAMCFWQIAHFFAIAIFRKDEYKNAGVPLLPDLKGFRRAHIEMLVSVVLFTLAALSVYLLHATRIWYAIGVILLGIGWIFLGIKGFSASDTNKWAKKMFAFSLIVISCWSLLLAFG